MTTNTLTEELKCPCCGRDFAGDEDVAAGDNCPADDCSGYPKRLTREEARCGMVAVDLDGCKVRLDHQVPGDSWEWSCDVWIDGLPGFPGYEQGRWSAEERRIHLSELTAA